MIGTIDQVMIGELIAWLSRLGADDRVTVLDAYCAIVEKAEADGRAKEKEAIAERVNGALYEALRTHWGKAHTGLVFTPLFVELRDAVTTAIAPVPPTEGDHVPR